jgi:predicted Zn-dependent protease
MKRVVATAFGVLLVLSIVDQAWLTRRLPPGVGVAPRFFPEAAAAFLERHHLDGHIFNSYKFGGYLMWRRWPANQVFIDGRYDAVLFDENLLEQYFHAHQSASALESLARVYGIEILIVDADPDRRIAHLERSGTWARVYWDSVAEIFLLRGGKYASVVAEREYRLTESRPDLGYIIAYRQDQHTWRQAIAELRRATVDNPKNEIAWTALAQEYAVAGLDAMEIRLEALQQALELLAENPMTARLQAERGETLLRLGRAEEAIAAAEKALREDASLILPRWVLAAVAEQRGIWGEARNQLRDILSQLDADHPMAAEVRERLEFVEIRLKGAAIP